MFALAQEKIKKGSRNFPTSFVAIFILLAVLLVPQFVDAQSLRFPTCVTADATQCGFNDFILMISYLIQFLLLLSIPIATLMFAWAGWMMITANGNSGKIDDAKEIFWDVLKGFVIALTAWLVVKLVTSALLAPDFLGDADLLGFIQTVLFLYS